MIQVQFTSQGLCREVSPHFVTAPIIFTASPFLSSSPKSEVGSSNDANKDGSIFGFKVKIKQRPSLNSVSIS